MVKAVEVVEGGSKEQLGFGGFMGLEPLAPWQELPYPDALLLTSGRACMALILDLEKPRRVHVPFYTCDTLLDPLVERGIEVVYYRMDDQLMPLGIPAPAADELIILIDYFGVRSAAVRSLALAIGPRAVIDSTHSFFTGPPPAGHYGFNSARKFRGVPDGGFLFTPQHVELKPTPNDRVHSDHLILRTLGSGEVVRKANRAHEERISTRIEGASEITRSLLHRLDHAEARTKRLANFAAAHAVLGPQQSLSLDLEELVGPLCYPLMPHRAIDLAQVHAAGIFAARYWPDVPIRKGAEQFPEDVARTQRLIAFPIDQRYTPEETSERAWQLTRMR